MTAICWYFGPFLLLILVTMILSAETGQNAAIEIFSDNAVIPPRPEASIHQHSHHRKHRGHKERMIAGQLRKRPHITVIHTQNEGPELKGLSPVRLEMNQGDKRRVMSLTKRIFMGFDSLIPEQMNISPGTEIPEKAMRHLTGRNNNKESGAPVKKMRVSFDQRLNKNSFGTPTEPVFPVAVGGEPSAQPTPTSKLQVKSYSDGDAIPTLNMAIFDWTDYEDMRLIHKQQSSKKRAKWNPGSDIQPTKTSSSGNVTLLPDVNCNHHLDCLPGSCCNLRSNVCELHNRGLNNKCYDNCMCEEGLQCSAKLHRHYRITRKKGRCVDPEGVNLNHVMFIVV
ncbi:draxin-like [Myxocyprinus asiaticus]|uniref:draxin-like n=1 Tax=Myxocyprinus asiaticus TaxID=70543 RepID=UPI002221D569|nr:draxin-like [Myxocyprinus asiaticus]XP_051516855.1 draxin-like [Myxocyprinus asiaticus]